MLQIGQQRVGQAGVAAMVVSDESADRCVDEAGHIRDLPLLEQERIHGQARLGNHFA
ncbi:hypothetical protein D3C87_2008160 [compost metagenome]